MLVTQARVKDLRKVDGPAEQFLSETGEAQSAFTGEGQNELGQAAMALEAHKAPRKVATGQEFLDFRDLG